MSMTVNSFGNTGYATSMTNQTFQKLASGKRINKAADDAAGLAIAKKLESLVGSLGKASNNAYDFQNALNTADGALDSITNSISRIRELGVQAANGIYTDSDRSMMQAEVNQLLDHIDHVGNSTEFNTKKLLDGSFTNQFAQTGPGSGSGQTISIDSSLVAALGLDGFDLSSGNVDFGALDNALEMVNSNRAVIGAQTNRLQHTINYNDIAQINQEAARSRIEDQDMAEGMMEFSRRKALEQYSIAMQKNMMMGAGNFLSLLG